MTSADAAPEDEQGVAYTEVSAGGGGTNQVRVRNSSNGELRFKANVQLNRIPGPRVEPTNIAFAYASCTDCQTFAIALQINLISRSAEYVAPENLALAVNVECTNCLTIARAIQYTMSVDDPTEVPTEVHELIKALDRELQAIKTTKGITAAEADQRVSDVIAQFRALAEGLRDNRDEATEETSPDATAEPEPSGTPDDATGTPSPDPSVTPSPDDPTTTPEPATATPEPATATPEPTATPTADPAVTATATETATTSP